MSGGCSPRRGGQSIAPLAQSGQGQYGLRPDASSARRSKCGRALANSGSASHKRMAPGGASTAAWPPPRRQTSTVPAGFSGAPENPAREGANRPRRVTRPARAGAGRPAVPVHDEPSCCASPMRGETHVGRAARQDQTLPDPPARRRLAPVFCRHTKHPAVPLRTETSFARRTGGSCASSQNRLRMETPPRRRPLSPQGSRARIVTTGRGKRRPVPGVEVVHEAATSCEDAQPSKPRHHARPASRGAAFERASRPDADFAIYPGNMR